MTEVIGPKKQVSFGNQKSPRSGLKGEAFPKSIILVVQTDGRSPSSATYSLGTPGELFILGMSCFLHLWDGDHNTTCP